MSTCSRRQVGAVVVQDRKVIGNGFNGVASGKAHCVSGGCPRGRLSYSDVPPGADYNQFPCYAIHAEHNAILQAGLERCLGATIYVTDQPCQQCANLIEHAKIGRVVIMGNYTDAESVATSEDLYRQEWATKTGRADSDIYIPEGIRDNATAEDAR